MSAPSWKGDGGRPTSVPALEDYAPIVGEVTLEELRLLARPLRGLRIKMVNSTRVGGGVAEILQRLVPLMGSLGITVQWDVMQGDTDFFEVTKQFHNAIHGGEYTLGEAGFDVFRRYNKRNAEALTFDEDVVVIHDPQPAALIERRRAGQRWVWRCHIDSSHPNGSVWGFLRPWIEQFDAAIFSAAMFAHNLPIPQFLFYPSIDPLSDKNRDLTEEEIDGVLARLDIPRDKPIVTQVSRFDRLKDPVGVIRAFHLARRYATCRLVLAGGGADDDPEGAQVLREARDAAGDDPDIHIVVLPPTANLEINALQRASAIIVQKSIREGFGLTVSEGLWKRKPVIAGAVGGIPEQIMHNLTGKLVHSVDGCAYQIRKLLSDPDQAERLGRHGYERVREEFLITSNLRRWLVLLNLLGQTEDIVRLEDAGATGAATTDPSTQPSPPEQNASSSASGPGGA
jgi:trehalose synthase